MSRPQVTRLRETFHTPPAPETTVIDARFTDVSRRKRGFLRSVTMAIVAVFWAAVIGFMIPPAWLFWEQLGAYFAAN